MSKQETVTVFYLHNIALSYNLVACSNWAETSPETYVLLGQQEVVFCVASDESAIVRAKVNGLEKRITKVRAEAQREVDSIKEAISNLLSITFQPEEF